MVEIGYDIDFDPTTQEGKENINEIVEDNYLDYEEMIKEDPSGKTLFEKLQGFKKGARWAYNRVINIFKNTNPKAKSPEYLKLEDLDDKENTQQKIIQIINSIKEIWKSRKII